MHLAGWAHLLFFGVLIPIGAWRSRARIREAGAILDRRRHYRAVYPQLLIFVAMSIGVAWLEWIPLTPRIVPDLQAWVAGAAILAALVVIMRPKWKRAVEKREPIVQLFMPSNHTERVMWIGIAILAGISEEITWRGVQQALLMRLTHQHYWIAALVCSAMFALAHLTQGWRSAAAIFPFALVFHALCYFTGTLYVAMAVHAVYDIIAGLTYGRLGRNYEALR